MTASEEAAVLATLQAMEADTQYRTSSKYHTNTEKYPNNLITFSEIHLTYLKKFPAIKPNQYINNLKLITRLR